MKKVLLAGAILAAVGVSGAHSQTAPVCTTDAAGNTFCDPTTLHVSTPGGTRGDPVLLNNDKTFTITDVSNGQKINSPLYVAFIVPGPASFLPKVTSATGTAWNGITGGGAANIPVTFGVTSVGPLETFSLTTG